MATTDLTTISDDEARMRAFQIVGSGLGAAAAVFNGDWRQALRATAAHWTPTPREDHAVKRTPEQIREDRNARRRAKRRAEQRTQMAGHAAFQLVSHGPWTNGIPDATPASVASRATHLYSSYLNGDAITTDEGAAALRYALQSKGLPTNHLDQTATDV